MAPIIGRKDQARSAATRLAQASALGRALYEASRTSGPGQAMAVTWSGGNAPRGRRWPHTTQNRRPARLAVRHSEQRMCAAIDGGPPGAWGALLPKRESKPRAEPAGREIQGAW